MARIPLRPPVVYVTPPAAADEEEEVEGGGRFSTRWLFWRAVLWLLIGFGVQTLASLMPEVVESLYSRGLYYYIARWLAVVNKYFAFSLGEAIFIVLAIWFTLWTFWYLGRAARKETRLIDVLKLLFLHVAWLASGGFALFLLLWGLNYQRLPLAETLGLERSPAGVTELAAVGRLIVDGVNLNYGSASQSGAAASQMTLSRPRLYQAIEEAFQREALLGAASQGEFAPPKPLKLSALLSRFGVQGLYIPYTGEANFNEQVPDCDLPFTIAHEKAHQRGYAREDEANFIAFLICAKATEAYVRYSGYLHALKALDVLAAADPALAATLRAQIGAGPIADLQARAAFWANAKNESLNRVARRVNDAHLRANRVRSGVKSYDEDTLLIVNYLLRRPAAPASPAVDPTPLPTGPTPLPTPINDPTPVAPPSQ